MLPPADDPQGVDPKERQETECCRRGALASADSSCEFVITSWGQEAVCGMRLRRLELSGFKSFPGRSTVEFSDGVTGIVGPNGCGKSNLVDAIRWVLGEQSPRQLRGSSMDDVLFKGSDEHPPAHVAEVSLTFENAEECWPTEEPALFELLKNATELTLTRRYYRGGEGEYLINRVPCRLRDIMELIAGNGIAGPAYAIIEQGRVEKLVLAKPDERRLLIEEAAGTSLYRARRLAAQRRMERTRENLARVTDILRELDRQIVYFQRLAKRSEQARSLREELRARELELAGAQRAELVGAEASLAARVRELHESLTRGAARLSACVAALAEVAQDVAQQTEFVQHLERSHERHSSELAAVQREEDLIERRRQEAAHKLTALGEQIRSIEADLVTAGVAVERETARRHEVWLGLLEAERRLRESRMKEARSKTWLAEVRTRFERIAHQEAELWRAEVEAKNRVERLERELQLAERARVTTEAELQVLRRELLSLEGQIVAAGIRLREAQRFERAKQGELKERDQALRASTEKAEEEARYYEQRRMELLEVESRLGALEKLRETYEGFNPSVRELLEDSQLRSEGHVLGVVADVLQVPAAWEGAVAAALGADVQCLIVDSAEAGLGAIAQLEQRRRGWARFIPVRPPLRTAAVERVLSLNGTSRPLLELVQVDPGFEELAVALFGPVAVAPSLPEGVRLWNEAGGDIIVVTPNGEAIDRRGVVSGGVRDRSADQQILARRRLIAELGSVRERLREKLLVVGDRCQKSTERREAAQLAFDRARHELLRIAATVAGLREEMQGRLVERKRLVDRLEERFRAWGRLRAEQDRAAVALAEAQGGLAQILQRKRQSPPSDVLAREMQRIQSVLDAAREEVTTRGIRVAELRREHESCVRALGAMRLELERLRDRREALLQQRDGERGAEAEGCEWMERIATRRSSLEAKVAELSRTIEEAKRRLKNARDKTAALEAERAALEAERDELQRRYREAEVALAECRVKLNHLLEDVQEKHGLTPPEWAERCRPLGQVEHERICDRINEIRGVLARLGDVGTVASDELEDTRARAEFLRKQKVDLEASLKDLERTIARLDQISQEKFRVTFEQVASHFRETLCRLFAGADARLALTGGAENSEPGVEIWVRLPGKRLESVSLLSGGEKALVSIGLLFALFTVNPTPFCILDEVDAPLDDANVARFMHLVREIRDRAQVLIVTHNKRTMEAADRLYGVTMATPGVSSVLTIRLSELAMS